MSKSGWFFSGCCCFSPCKRFKDTVKVGLKWCGIPPTELVATALERQRWCTFTVCIICTRGRALPPSAVCQRTLPLGSLYPSNNCELPVPSLRTALQVQDQPAESLPYPQIRGTDNVILETTMMMMSARHTPSKNLSNKERLQRLRSS